MTITEATTGTQTLQELEATRQLIIDNREINPKYTAWLTRGYDEGCRAAGLDPETWEGLR